MMKQTLGLLLVMGLVGAPAALAQQVTIDYAHDFDFEAVKTFEYVETKDSNSANQLVDGRIKDAIIKELIGSGLKQLDSNPDILVTYHLTTKENTVYNTSNYGYGGYYGGGWGPWGGGLGMGGDSITTTSTYTEGTLIIDAYEPGEKKLLWHGAGTVAVKSKPEKQTQQIDNIVTKLGKKWQKILVGKGE